MNRLEGRTPELDATMNDAIKVGNVEFSRERHQWSVVRTGQEAARSRLALEHGLETGPALYMRLATPIEDELLDRLLAATPVAGSTIPEPLTVERLSDAMSDAYEYTGDTADFGTEPVLPFVDDGVGFWRPFASKVLALLGGSTIPDRPLGAFIAETFAALRRRLVGTPPNVDSIDAAIGYALDECEAAITAYSMAEAPVTGEEPE